MWTLGDLISWKKRKGKRVRKRRREKKERGKGRREGGGGERGREEGREGEVRGERGGKRRREGGGEGGGKNKQVLRLKASTTLSSFSTIFNLTLLTWKKPICNCLNCQRPSHHRLALRHSCQHHSLSFKLSVVLYECIPAQLLPAVEHISLHGNATLCNDQACEWVF